MATTQKTAPAIAVQAVKETMEKFPESELGSDAAMDYATESVYRLVRETGYNGFCDHLIDWVLCGSGVDVRVAEMKPRTYPESKWTNVVSHNQLMQMYPCE